MSNIIDYLKWRGDIPFSASPLNEVDALIFSQLSYVDFRKIVPEVFSTSTSLGKAARLFNENINNREKVNISNFEQTITLLNQIEKSERYNKVRVCGFVDSRDEVLEKQFAAVTFILDEQTMFISYRGTDDTIIGWKEDFNMSYLAPVPSHIASVEYLNNAGKQLKHKIILGGHSKGGNLAIYAAAFCLAKIQKRILKVYNNDGPGFDSEIIQKENIQKISSLVITFMPQSSIIGMLLNHTSDYTIIESNETLIMQHDPFSWQVFGSKFVTRNHFDCDSKFFDSTIKEWLHEIDDKQKEKFINTLYELLTLDGSTTMTEVASGWAKQSINRIQFLSKLDTKTKNAVLQTVMILFKAAQKNIPTMFQSLLSELK